MQILHEMSNLLFSGTSKKNILKCLLLKILPSMLSVKSDLRRATKKLNLCHDIWTRKKAITAFELWLITTAADDSLIFFFFFFFFFFKKVRIAISCESSADDLH